MSGKIIEQATAPVAEEENAPANESKADKFRRLMNARMTATLDKIRLLSNLSNRASYEYTPEQVEKIMAALRNEIDWLEREFQPRAAETKKVFEL